MRWRPLPAFAAIDFLSCLVVVFVAVALTSRPPEVKTYGAYAVVVTWPKQAKDDDVDLYLRDPSGAISYFARPQVDEMQLEHDDRGTAKTGYAHVAENQERTVVRTATPGQWIANVHLFKRGQGPAPVPVVVTLWDLRSEDHAVYTNRRKLTSEGDEQTAFRFTIDHGGNAGGFSQLPLSLISPTTSYPGS
jgi:hypothetical protein